MFQMEKLEAFPPGENPFWHDVDHMGVRLGKNIMVMYPNHPDEEMKYLILVNVETGERIKVRV